jgi:hypothetical protein
MNDMGGPLPGDHLLYLAGIGHIQGNKVQPWQHAGELIFPARGSHHVHFGLMHQQVD